MMILENIFTLFSSVSSSKLFFYISWAYDYASSLLSLSSNWAYDIASILTHTFGTEAIVMSIKFLMSVSLLIFIRGAIPRYRFDHLTRIGWVKFLTLVVCFLLIELLFLYTLVA